MNVRVLQELSTCDRLARLRREDAEHMARFLRLPYVQGVARDQLQAYINKQLDAAAELERTKIIVLAWFETIPDATEREIMLLRYRDGLTWAKVAEAVHYSCENVQRIHKKIMQRLEATTTTKGVTT